MPRVLLSLCLTIVSASFALAAPYVQVELPIAQLPQEHEYQKQLRSFIATLTEKDFDVERKEFTVVPTTEADDLFRMWLMTLHMHDASAATLPSSSFTLSSIEGARGLVLPCAPQECQMLAWLAKWDYAGNPYQGSRPLKLRAFVLAATDVMALDYLYAHDPRGADRSDYLGGNLIWLGYTFQAVKNDLPPAATAPLEAGLKKLVLTLNAWGPRGLMTDMDLFAPVGLRYISQALDDAQVKQIAEAYSRRLFTEERFYHPAGYFVDNGCFDTSYNGISLYFGAWAALASDWKFAHEAIDKAYRLRAHLSFPHPDGTFSGPSAMASRCSGDPPRDQWQFPPKIYGSGMVTDEALPIAPLPTPAQLAAAPASVVARLNAQLAKPRATTSQPWRESHWSGGAINFAYEFYRKGYYERRLKLAQEDSPLVKPLYLRDEHFVREFDKAFVVARTDSYAAAIHTGPVGGVHKEWQRPYGFGGGQLCAFWTPKTGPVILNRRRGVQGHVYDTFDEWRTWPVHAVTGVTAAGDVISSSRIERPEVESLCSESTADVRVSGIIPKYVAARQGCVPTDLRYERRFLLDTASLKVRTAVTSPGQEKLAELYETVPIFLRETANQKMPAIHFQRGGAWMEGSVDPLTGVHAVKVERFGGAILIAFAVPATVRLSPTVWRDGFQTQAECRTLLVDLLSPRDGTVENVSIEYTISAAQ